MRNRNLTIGFLVFLLFGHGYFLSYYPNFTNPNITSRMYAVLSNVDFGTWAIDEWLNIRGNTQDKAFFDGHHYSDKAPGFAAILLPVAWAGRKLGIPLEDFDSMVTWVRVFGLSLPTILFWMMSIRVYKTWTGRHDYAVAVALSGAIGTPFFIYATRLFAHVPAGILLFGSFWMVRRCKRTVETDASPLQACLIAGCLAGLAFTVDYIVVLAVVVLFGYSLTLRRFTPTFAAAFGFGVLIPLLLWMCHNYQCFDHPLRVGFHFHEDAQYGDKYQSGLFGIQMPDAMAVLGMTISPERGLFFIAPVLALAIIGWAGLFRDPLYRGDAVVSILVFLAIFSFATTTVDWRGGWSVGPRYLVPTIPFLLIGVAGACRSQSAGSAPMVLFVVLSYVGIASMGISTAGFPAFPGEYRNPVYHFSLPLVRDGFTAPTVLPESLYAYDLPIYMLYLTGCSVFLGFCVITRSAALGVAQLAVASAGAFAIMVGFASYPENGENLRERRFTGIQILGRMGYGPIYYPTGHRYIGQTLNGLRHGRGLYNYPDGTRYVGDFVYNRLQGAGRLTLPDGSRYSGGFRDGAMDGFGTFVRVHGERYVGNWRNSRMEGQGTLYDAQGNVKHRGQWRNGEFARARETDFHPRTE